jgi:cation transport ATPase
MLTGDNSRVANKVAEELGLDKVYSVITSTQSGKGRNARKRENKKR